MWCGIWNENDDSTRKRGIIMAEYDKLVNAMAETLSENSDVKYAKFLIKTMTLPDGRLAEFSYRLEPIEDDKVNTPAT